jgi:hypothetical protein
VPDPRGLHPARIGFEVPGDHPHERGLSRPVRPGDEHPLAGLDGGLAHGEPPVDADAVQLGLRHLATGAAGAQGGGEPQLLRRPRDRFGLQPAHPLLRVPHPRRDLLLDAALVAAVDAVGVAARARLVALGGDAGELALRGQLLRPARVPLLPLPPRRGLRRGVTGVAAAVALHGAPLCVDLPQGGRHPLQEPPVVGDDDERTAVAAQVLLQPLRRTPRRPVSRMRPVENEAVVIEKPC